jgi:hypothetical protein
MSVSESLVAKNREYYTYRCKQCGFECRKKVIPGSSVPVTAKGNYGSEGTPTPESFADEIYEATTIGFVAAVTGVTPAYLTDSAYLFGVKNFKSGMTIRIAGSTSNDKDCTIATGGVSRGEILLSDSDSLTTEGAGDTVTISQILYSPNIVSGCPFCGSRNS